MERLNPLNDFMFKKIFGEEKDKEILIGFLNAILKADISDLTIENDKLSRETKDEKLGILDIKAKTNSGEKINIEVQTINKYNMVPRTLFYWSKLYIEDFKPKSDYDTLQKTVTINILNYEMQKLRNQSFHTIFQLQEKESKLVLTDLLEIHFIEVPKFFKKSSYDVNNPLHRWLLFLNKDVPDSLLKEVTQMDSLLQKAEEKFERLSSDPDTRKEYEARAKALSDEISRLNGAEREGILKVAKSLLDSGMPLAEVANHTPYSAEELERYLKSNRTM